MYKVLGISCAAALLMALPVATYAKPGGNKGGSGASSFSPGYQMRNGTAGYGASYYAPGQKMRRDITGSTRGASQFAPGYMKRQGSNARGRGR